MHGGFLHAYHVVFLRESIFTVSRLPQLWRLVSPFLLTGPKFGLLMDPYFLYTYGSGLERGSPRFTELGSFFVYNVFVMAFILVSVPCSSISISLQSCISFVTASMPFAYRHEPSNYLPAQFF